MPFQRFQTCFPKIAKARKLSVYGPFRGSPCWTLRFASRCLRSTLRSHSRRRFPAAKIDSLDRFCSCGAVASSPADRDGTKAKPPPDGRWPYFGSPCWTRTNDPRVETWSPCSLPLRNSPCFCPFSASLLRPQGALGFEPVNSCDVSVKQCRWPKPRQEAK